MTSWTAVTLQKDTSEDLETDLQKHLKEHKLKEHDKVIHEDKETLKFELIGSGRHMDAYDIIRDLQEHLEDGLHAVIDMNDTVDAGTGTIYRIDNFHEEIRPYEIVTGQESECGLDVAHEIMEEMEVMPCVDTTHTGVNA